MSKLKDAFLDGTSSTYLEDLEERYHKDPNSVDKSWTSFFRSLGMLVDLHAIRLMYSSLSPTYALMFRARRGARGSSRGLPQL